jgi:hypothetical protein
MKTQINTIQIELYIQIKNSIGVYRNFKKGHSHWEMQRVLPVQWPVIIFPEVFIN